MEVLENNQSKTVEAKSTKMTCLHCKSVIKVKSNEWRVGRHDESQYVNCPVCSGRIGQLDNVYWYHIVGFIGGIILTVWFLICLINTILMYCNK